jgi:hypothetical protein
MRRAALVASLIAGFLATGGTCGSDVIWCRLDAQATPEQPVIDLGNDETYEGVAKVSSVTIHGFDLSSRHSPMDEPARFWVLTPAPTWRYARIDKLVWGTVPAGLTPLESLIPLRMNHAYEVIFANGGNNWYSRCLFMVSEDSLGARSIRELTDQQFSDTVFDFGGR